MNTKNFLLKKDVMFSPFIFFKAKYNKDNRIHRDDFGKTFPAYCVIVNPIVIRQIQGGVGEFANPIRIRVKPKPYSKSHMRIYRKKYKYRCVGLF